MTALAQARWWEDLDAHKAATQNLWAAFALAYPVGCEVRWDRAGHIQVGRVMHHGYTGRLRVLNVHTGAEYWLHASSLLRPE